jgi:4-amino-4-deoxy-L-arabinose transferase-like glycosyltransferase
MASERDNNSALFPRTSSLAILLQKIWHHRVGLLFTAILLIGAILRLWMLGTVPPGLNQDEASIGVEAYALYHYGVDRNAVSFPVNFISWGSGQDALYIYCVLPFMGLGLSPIVERLPMALAGVLTLPLVFWIGRRCVHARFGLLAMFLVAISPWHIMLSRWGLNDNILTFCFVAAVAALVQSRKDNYWFFIASVLFGICLYAYGAAYVAVPIFFFGACVYFLLDRRVTIRTMLLGCASLAAVATPIALFLAVNSLGWNPIQWGPITIPRFPVKPRYEHMGIIFSPDLLQSLVSNLNSTWNVLWLQTDEFIWNTLPRYGYGYPGALLIACAGLVVYLAIVRRESAGPHGIIPLWLISGLAIGMVQEVNVNRLNVLFIVILMLMAFVLDFLFRRFRWLAWGAILGYIGLALIFTRMYLGGRYAEMASEAYLDGFVPALQSAVQDRKSPICVTDHVVQPYVYALWAEPGDPREYVPTLVYSNPNTQFRTVAKITRFTFGIQRCEKTADTIYVLWDEMPPADKTNYREEVFARFHVYFPLHQA